MADKVELEILIRTDGTLTLTTHGLKGTQCTAETEALEKTLGRVRMREKTREAYEQSSSAKVTVRGKK